MIERSNPSAIPEIDPSLPTVVFIHGIGGGAKLWMPQMTSFSAAGYRPVALDLPGYGERPAVDHMDFEGLAADVETAIERLGLARPVLAVLPPDAVIRMTVAPPSACRATAGSVAALSM